VSLAGRLRVAYRLAATTGLSLFMFFVAVLFRGLTFGRPAARYRGINRMMRIWAWGTAWIWGMRIRVEGTPPTEPFFLVSNHLGYTDILVVCAVCPAWFISKSEVAKWPGIGPLTRMGHTIFIDRETRRDVHRMNRLVAELIRDGGAVGFFPEGTTTDGTDVLPFKPSLLQPAVELGLPVTPAAIAYTTPADAPSPAELIAWVGDADFGPHLLHLLAHRGFTARIRFGDADVRADDRKELARLSREAVQGLLRELNAGSKSNSD